MSDFTAGEQEKVQLVCDMLHEWNGQFRPESREATAFTLYFHNSARLLFSKLDESMIERVIDTDEFLDGYLKINDQVIKNRSQNSFNDALCSEMAKILGQDRQDSCSYLMAYAIL